MPIEGEADHDSALAEVAGLIDVQPAEGEAIDALR